MFIQIFVISAAAFGVGKDGVDAIQFPHLLLGCIFQLRIGLLIGMQEAHKQTERVADLLEGSVRHNTQFFVIRDFAGAMRPDHIRQGIPLYYSSETCIAPQPKGQELSGYNQSGSQSCPVAGTVFKTAERPSGRWSIRLRLVPAN
jgi:hypothetical protein